MTTTIASNEKCVSNGRPRAHIAEDIEFLLDSNPSYTTHGMAERLGLTRGGVEHALKKSGRLDLWKRLVRNLERETGLEYGKH